MAGLQKFYYLHWQWPFESQVWNNGNNKIVPVHVTWGSKDTPAIGFDGAATIDVVNRPVMAPIVRQRVNAPLSGRVRTVVRTTDVVGNVNADVEIVTKLSDGTVIHNYLKGLFDAPPKIQKDYAVEQGEWIGYSNELPGYPDLPHWVCWVAMPGEAGKYVYADDFAEDHGEGIDWKDKSAGIPEIFYPEPARKPILPGGGIINEDNKGMLLIGAAVAAWLLLKGK